MSTRLRCILFCTVGHCAFTQAAPLPELGARLLAVQKDGRTALFLPETHIGTPAQCDRYFQQTIKPAFAASSMLLLESAASPRFDTAFHQRACPDEGSEEAALDPALNAAVRASPASALDRVAPLSDDLGALGRFFRFDILLRATAARTRGDAAAAAPGDSAAGNETTVDVLPAQSGRLMMAAPRPYRSVDDTASLFQAYCGLHPAERVELIRSLLDTAMAPEKTSAPVSTSAAQSLHKIYRNFDTQYRAALEGMRAALRDRKADGRSAATKVQGERGGLGGTLAQNRFLIAQRNRGWLAQLPAVLTAQRLPFYALGAAHFADGSYGPGLLSLLRWDGYRITLIDGPATLRTVLAQLPAALVAAPASPELPLAVRALNGACMRIPGNYSCSWGDGSTLYSATSLSPSSGQELLTLCYARPAIQGTVNRCIMARMARPPQRDADLARSQATVAPVPPI